MFRAHAWGLLLLAALTVSTIPGPLAQLPTPGVDVDIGATGGVDLQNGTVNGTVGGSVDGAVGGALDPITNATVPQLGSRARFTFQLPLNEGPTFAFMGSDATPRDKVVIKVHWQDATGQPKAFPAATGPRAVLELDNRERLVSPPVLRYEENGTVAVFEVGHPALLQGAHTSWRLTARAPGEAVTALDATVSLAHSYREGGKAVRIHIHDRDVDGWPDDIDNCRDLPNPDQANLDGDMHGDACDEDIDDDGASNDEERIARSDPYNPDSTPDDPDADGYNNTEEIEAGSGPYDPASTPLDPDADGYNNTEEADAGSDPRWSRSTPLDVDGDGFPNEQDVCPHRSDDQTDTDGDGIGDACDDLPQDGPTGDADGDGIINRDDNCRVHVNAGQADLDGDGAGDACDSDIDGDGYPHGVDAFPRDPAEWRDNDRDGIGDNADQDDDNDGLSDMAEAGYGTDPLRGDTDGDLLGDLLEISQDTDPLDRFDPPFMAIGVSVEATGEGASVRWTGSDDSRVSHYLVWHRSPLRLVGSVQATGASDYQMLDPHPEAGDHMYSVQAVLEGQPDRFVRQASTSALVFASQILAAQAGPDASAADVDTGASPELAPAPGKDSPGLAPAVLLVVVVWIARRVRR